MTDIAQTLQQRGQTHGHWPAQSAFAQSLKTICRNAADLDPVLQESIDMICVKLSRICIGNPREHDHWHDIAGYAKLAADYLDKDGQG